MAAPVIIFAKTRHHYDSYTDFWDLVRLSGFPTCHIDEIDVEKDAFFILSPWNGEVSPHLRNELAKKRRARVAWWCLERFDAMSVPYVQAIDEADPLVDEIWVSDRWISTLDRRIKYVVFGSDPGLGAEPLPAQYDFTHQSYSWGRREAMYNRLKMAGLREGPSGWGAQRHEVLRRSRLVLNLQQYPDPVTAPLRFAMAAAYHLPIVSETIKDPDPLGGLVRIASYDDVPRVVAEVLADGGRRDAEALYQRLCVDFTFRTCVEAAL